MTPIEFGVSRLSKVKVTVTFKLRGHAFLVSPGVSKKYIYNYAAFDSAVNVRFLSCRLTFIDWVFISLIIICTYK